MVLLVSDLGAAGPSDLRTASLGHPVFNDEGPGGMLKSSEELWGSGIWAATCGQRSLHFLRLKYSFWLLGLVCAI